MSELFEYTTIAREGGIMVCIITNYIGSSKEVVIPKTISIEGKNIPVKIISYDAFYNKGLTSVDLSNVGYIGEGAFENNNLTSIDLSNVEVIDERAFAENDLTSIDFKNVRYIGQSAFAYNKLTRINLSGVKSIYYNAFMHNKLKSVDLSRVEEISGYAFCDNNLEIIILPEKFRDKTEWIFGFDNEELESRNKKYIKKIQELYMKKLYKNSKKYKLIFEYITYYTYNIDYDCMLKEAIKID